MRSGLVGNGEGRQGAGLGDGFRVSQQSYCHTEPWVWDWLDEQGDSQIKPSFQLVGRERQGACGRPRKWDTAEKTG